MRSILSDLHPALHSPLTLSCPCPSEILVTVEEILNQGLAMVKDDRLLHDTQSMLQVLGVDVVLSCRKNEQEPLPTNDDAVVPTECLPVAADAVDKERDQTGISVGDDSSDEVKVEIIIKLEYDVENVTKDTESTGEFKCPQCDFCGDDIFDLNKHTRGHGGEKTYEHVTSFTSRDDNHSTQNQVNGRKCIKKKETAKKTRSKVVTRKFSLRSSDRQEVEETETTTNGKGVVKKHRRRMRRCEKPLKCMVCDYYTSSSSCLKMHTRRVHGGEKPYKCTVCDFSAVTSSEFKSHMMKHTGEKPGNLLKDFWSLQV